MKDKTVAKILLVFGILCILGSLLVAYLIFALRDGPIGAIPYLGASLAMGIGIVLLVMAKKKYGE
jgi:hypothetical protein